ncbi:membrane hypothetical protein [Burkholderia cepacia]|nr:membrane hypothetical protein [Burkholderia cepacia]
MRQLGVDSQSAVIQWSGVSFRATFLRTAVTAPLRSRLADRFGCKPMLVRAAIGMAIVMSLIGIAHNVVELVAPGLVGGCASTSTVMVNTQAPRERAGWELDILSTGAVAGNPVGPLVGGLLPGWVGIRGTFFAGGAMIAVVALLTIFFVKEDFHADTDAKARTSGSAAGTAQRSNRVAVIALLVTAMMVLLVNMSIEPIVTVYIGGLGVGGDGLVRIAGVVMGCSALDSMLTAARLGALLAACVVLAHWARGR